MRVTVIVGIALIILGGFLLFGGRFTTRRNVLEIGDVKVSAEEKHTVSPLIAGAAVVGGVGLVAFGLLGKASR